jgi:hypothetical protein
MADGGQTNTASGKQAVAREQMETFVDVKPGAWETFKPQFERVTQVFNETMDRYEQENPEWLKIWTLGLIQEAVYNFKSYLEDPRETDISWENPIAELCYPFEVDWETIEKAGWESLGTERPGLLLFKVAAEDFKDLEGLSGKVAEGVVKARARFVFELLAGGNPIQDPLEVALGIDGDKSGLLLSPQLGEKLDKLPSWRRQRALHKLAERGKELSFRFDSQVTVTPDELKGAAPAAELGAAKTYRLKGTLWVKFSPFVMDRGNRQAYYPAYVGLKLRGLRAGFTPDKWSEKLKRAMSEKLLGGLLKTLAEQTPAEKLPELKLSLAIPEPQVRAASRGAGLVKVSLHAERQKFGEVPKPKMLSLFEEFKAEAEEHHIEVVGVDITATQDKALFAVQTALNETDYKGNLPPRSLDLRASPFKFSGSVPLVRLSLTRYLDLYGVGKRETARGYLEYNANERTEALKALRALNDKRWLLYYERRYWVDGRERFDVIKTVRPLLAIIEGYEALTRAERDSVKSGETSKEADEKLKTIVIEPSPILVDQVGGHFALKPANCYQEVKLLAPHASKFVYNLIDYLVYEAGRKGSKGKPLVVRIGFVELAHTLRMKSWIEKSQWAQIRGSLDKSYEIAKTLGYLLDYKTVKGTTKDLEELTLNPDKFRENKGAEDRPALPQALPKT